MLPLRRDMVLRRVLPRAAVFAVVLASAAPSAAVKTEGAVRPPSGTRVAAPAPKAIQPPANRGGAAVRGAAPTATANPCRAALEIGDLYWPSRLTVASAFLMPGERRRLVVLDLWEGERVEFVGSTKRLVQVARNVWEYRAPSWHPHSAFVRMRVYRGEKIVARKAVNFLTMVPRSHMRGEYLNGYRIGEYAKKKAGKPETEPPRGFVELTSESRSLWVSDHFQLGDFACKQAADGPRYLAVQERLLLKLERLQHGLSREYPWARLKVMSGFRTPHYNRLIGAETTYSRHVYGAAADLYIAEDPSHRPPRRELVLASRSADYREARVLVRLVRELDRHAESSSDRGGLGHYCDPGRRAFVHVDCRGRIARW